MDGSNIAAHRPVKEAPIATKFLQQVACELFQWSLEIVNVMLSDYCGEFC
jgi:hypothetical protein